VRAASDRLLHLSDVGPDRRPSDLPCGHRTTAGVRTKLPPLGVRVAMRPALWPESGLASVARRLGSPVRGVGVRRKRWPKRSRCARPNICRFTILRRFMWPSTGPVLQGNVTPALTA
jgi:hypothetical protein